MLSLLSLSLWDIVLIIVIVAVVIVTCKCFKHCGTLWNIVHCQILICRWHLQAMSPPLPPSKSPTNFPLEPSSVWGWTSTQKLGLLLDLWKSNRTCSCICSNVHMIMIMVVHGWLYLCYILSTRVEHNSLTHCIMMLLAGPGRGHFLVCNWCNTHGCWWYYGHLWTHTGIPMNTQTIGAHYHLWLPIDTNEAS
jgi:hypothetical protein